MMRLAGPISSHSKRSACILKHDPFLNHTSNQTTDKVIGAS